MSSGGGSTRWRVSVILALAGLCDGVSAAGLDSFHHERGWAVYFTSALAFAVIVPVVLVTWYARHDETERHEVEKRRDALVEEAAKSGRIMTDAARIEATKRFLAAAAHAFSQPGKKHHVRANVMLVTGKHRCVQPETAYNMEGDPDRDLKIEAGAGVSGYAFTSRKVAFGDLQLVPAPGAASWALPPSVQGKLRKSLRSVLSAPIFDPKDTRPAQDQEPIATLQIDSDEDPSVVWFDSEDAWKRAQFFADALAFVVKG
jgi:hypothetical protein